MITDAVIVKKTNVENKYNVKLINSLKNVDNSSNL